MKYYVLEHPRKPSEYVVQGAEGWIPENNLGLSPDLDGEPCRKGFLLKVVNGTPEIDLVKKAAYDQMIQDQQNTTSQRDAKIAQIKAALAAVDDISNLAEAKAFLKKLVKYIGLMDLDS